jgi:hypothetical protein
MGGRSRPWVVSSLNKSSRPSSSAHLGEVERERGEDAAAETLEAAGVDGDIS